MTDGTAVATDEPTDVDFWVREWGCIGDGASGADGGVWRTHDEFTWIGRDASWEADGDGDACDGPTNKCFNNGCPIFEYDSTPADLKGSVLKLLAVMMGLEEV